MISALNAKTTKLKDFFAENKIESAKVIKGKEKVVEEKPIPQPEPQPKKVDTGIVTDADNAVPFAAWENALNHPGSEYPCDLD